MTEWKPIETAPRIEDGKQILVFGTDERFHVVFYAGIDATGYDWFDGEVYIGATHWMPLPEPPK